MDRPFAIDSRKGEDSAKGTRATKKIKNFIDDEIFFFKKFYFSKT